MKDNGSCKFSGDPSRGVIIVEVRPPLAIAPVKVEIAIEDFFTQMGQALIGIMGWQKKARGELMAEIARAGGKS